MLSKLYLKLTCFAALILSLACITYASDETTPVSSDTLPGMTITELAKFDGQDGRMAYVAVDSIIYDVTNVKAWKGGKHKGNKAGTDISVKIAKAPHAKKPIQKLNKVGKLIPATAADTTKN